MSRIDEVYARIAEADRPEVFITLRPEAEVRAEYERSVATGGPLARLRDGDLVRVDAVAGTLECLEPDFADRTPATYDPDASAHGMGRELFAAFRAHVGPADEGAGIAVR